MTLSLTAAEILARLRHKEKYEDLGRGATLEEIRDIEEKLDVVISKEYEEFLRACGYAFWFGTSIFGVAPSAEDSVVHWTLKARGEPLPRGFAARPKNALVVHDYGGGGYYFLLDATTARSGEVVLLTDDMMGAEADSYPSFWAFLRTFA